MKGVKSAHGVQEVGGEYGAEEALSRMREPGDLLPQALKRIV